MENKKVFITFGGPTQEYRNATKRVAESAKQFGIFTSSIGLNDDFLRGQSDFWKKHGKFLETNRRGYGYWLWKPYIIKTFLDKLQDGDILVYADAGCVINLNGLPRLNEYIEMLNTNEHGYGILSFQMNHQEVVWTKRGLLEYINSDLDCSNDLSLVNDHSQSNLEHQFRTNMTYADMLSSGQCMATSMIIKKNPHSTMVINKWLQLAEHYELINDDKMNQENHNFRDHRHDQSIYSLLVKKYGSIKIPDETWYANWEDGKHTPILAMRIRS